MKTLKMSAVALATSLIVACGGGGGGGNNAVAPGVDGGAEAPDVGAADATYTVSVVNLTQSQPMSPPAIVMHQSGFNAFIDGEPASFGIEVMAEGGSPVDLLVEAQAAPEHIVSVPASDVALVPPLAISEDETLVVPSENVGDLRLTLLTMMIDTNDAFTGTNAVDISNMTVGEQRIFNQPTWDAGTEDNLETADTMPGPAAQQAGGLAEGFNPARDDIQPVVHFHQGVVTSANANDPSREGLSTSILTEIDRWDNPASRIVVTRTQ